MNGRGPPPYSYVTSIQVPDPNFLTLRAVLVRVAQEYHLLPDMVAIEASRWQTWITPWYEAMTPTSSRTPWFFMDCYRAIRSDHLDVQLTTMVAPGAPGYSVALQSAHNRTQLGVMHLPYGAPVCSLYLEQQVLTFCLLCLRMTNLSPRERRVARHGRLKAELDHQGTD
jgi:hypothetical protein